MISESVQKELRRIERRTNKAIKEAAGASQTDTEVRTFNTVADLEAANGNVGSEYRLLGYYEPGDFGQALSLICVEEPTYGNPDGSVHSYLFNNGKLANLYVEGPLNVLWYGAYNDKTHPAETTSAVQEAISEAGAYWHEGRGRWFDARPVFFPRGEYYINDRIIVYEGVTLIGETPHPGGVKLWDEANHGTKIRFKTYDKGFRVMQGATIQNMVIQHYDIEFGSLGGDGDYAPLLAMQSNGYAIGSIENDGDGTHAYGCCIRDCIIAGFNSAIDFRHSTQGGGRYRIENVLIDSWNGVIIEGTGDVCRLRDVHCWPLLNVFDGDYIKQERGGTAFMIERGGDWAQISGCFSFGYQIGFHLKDANLTNISQCSVDGPEVGYYNGSILVRSIPIVGFLIEGDSTNTIITNAQTGGHPGVDVGKPNSFQAIKVNIPDDGSPSNNTVTFSNCTFTGFNDIAKVSVQSCNFLQFNNCTFAAGEKTFLIEKTNGLRVNVSNSLISAQPGHLVEYTNYANLQGTTNSITFHNTYIPSGTSIEPQSSQTISIN